MRETADPARLGRFWQAVQRTSALAVDGTPAAPIAHDLLAELLRTFEIRPRLRPGPTARGLAARGRRSRARGPPAFGAPSVALRGPDGLVLEPADWLQVPARWEGESPLIRHLINAQPLITGLLALRRSAQGGAVADDPGFGSLGWSLAFQDRGAAPDPALVRSTFEAAYRRWKRPGDPLALHFKELARRLYAGLTESGMTLVPALNPVTLEPIASDGKLPRAPTSAGWWTTARPVRSWTWSASASNGAPWRPYPEPRSPTSAGTGRLGRLVARRRTRHPPPGLHAWRAELPGLLARPDLGHQAVEGPPEGVPGMGRDRGGPGRVRPAQPPRRRPRPHLARSPGPRGLVSDLSRDRPGDRPGRLARGPRGRRAAEGPLAGAAGRAARSGTAVGVPLCPGHRMGRGDVQSRRAGRRIGPGRGAEAGPGGGGLGPSRQGRAGGAGPYRPVGANRPRARGPGGGRRRSRPGRCWTPWRGRRATTPRRPRH